MRFAQLTYGSLLLLIVINACVEPYDPPLQNEDVNMLVVDGFLNATDDSARISLARTLPVKSSDMIPPESGALVRIEDDRGLIHTLAEMTAGIYEGAVPGAGAHATYRLLIRTQNNREYVSDFTTVPETPEIDSITYRASSQGVEFFVSTHDATNNARNYRWTFQETYQYNASFNSLFMFEGVKAVFRPLHQSLFTCWRSDRSTDILVTSTRHLQESVVNKFPVAFISSESIKMSVKYSMLLQQHALTDEAYDYWLQLERSTENLGGLFDPLPSEVQGNIKSITDPSETVIGLFSAGTVQEKRIFVKRSDLPRELAGYFRGNPLCRLDSVPVSELSEVHHPSTLLVDALYSGPAVVGYTTATIGCADCRTMGGNTTRPLFWE